MEALRERTARGDSGISWTKKRVNLPALQPPLYSRLVGEWRLQGRLFCFNQSAFPIKKQRATAFMGGNMYVQLLVDSLYRELLFTSMILLVILLINNLALYRQKLTSHFSMMLLCGTAMCAFELLWDVLDDHAAVSPLIYFCAGAYTMAFLNFAVFFNRYFLERFGIPVRKKWLLYLFYGLPNAVILMLCVTTPWTHWFFMVDEGGLVREMPLYRTLFYGVMWVYSLSALGLAARYLFTSRKQDESLGRIARSLIVFGFLLPAIYLMQRLILGDGGSDYLALSLAVSIALVYLTANVNIHALLSSQAQVEAVEADLRIAAKIQSDALPPPCPNFPEHPEISLRACMTTAKEVGGDFYDYFVLDENRICFLIADVSGKGMAAAILMSNFQASLKALFVPDMDLPTLVNRLNRIVVKNSNGDRFITFFIGRYNFKTNVLRYVNAGHNSPLLYNRKTRELSYLDTGCVGVGMLDEIVNLKEGVIKLDNDYKLLCFTDGVVELESDDDPDFGQKVVKNCVGEDIDIKTTISSIIKSLDIQRSNTKLFDDITLLGIDFYVNTTK